MADATLRFSAFAERRIGIVLGALAAGSRERTIFLLAERLHAAGAKVDFLIPGPGKRLLDQLPAAADVVDISPRACRGLPNKLRLALAPPAIARYLRSVRPDAVMTLSIPPGLATLAARRLAGSRCPIVLRQSNVIRIAESKRYGHVSPRWRDSLIRRLYPDADAVIAVSAGVADNLIELGIDPGRVHAIANGIQIDQIEQAAAMPVSHPWLDEPGPPVIVAVGRLVGKKDYPTLFHALVRLRDQRETRLIILGEGPARRELEQLIEALNLRDVVHLAGRVENPFAYLTRASLYVLSSTFEGMPSALIEALACGCPAVSTDCPSGPGEILDDGRFGQLVPIGDSQALAKAMAATLDDPPPRAQQRRRARTFAAELTVERYLGVLDQVCRKAQSLKSAPATTVA